MKARVIEFPSQSKSVVSILEALLTRAKQGDVCGLILVARTRERSLDLSVAGSFEAQPLEAAGACSLAVRLTTQMAVRQLFGANS